MPKGYWVSVYPPSRTPRGLMSTTNWQVWPSRPQAGGCIGSRIDAWSGYFGRGATAHR